MHVTPAPAVLDHRRLSVVSSPIYWTRNTEPPTLSVPDVVSLLGRGTPRRFQTLAVNVGALPPSYLLKDGAAEALMPSAIATASPGSNSSPHILALQVREALRTSLRQLAGVHAGNLGLLLSGGLDSTILACELVRIGVRPLCFVADSPGRAGPKEHGYAARVCHELGLSLTRVGVSPADLDHALDALVARHPRPLLCWVVASQFAIARAAAQRGCTGLAIGIGSDEIFGGYHKAGRIMHRFEEAKRTKNGRPWESLINGPNRARRRLLFIGQCCPFPRPALRRLFPDADLDSIFEEDVTTIYREVHADSPDSDGARAIMEVELALRVPDILVAELTAATQAAGLVLHFPFLAERVLATARAIPARYKYAHDAIGLIRFPPATKAYDKLILRLAFEDVVPSFVQLRPRATFTVPFHYWLCRNTILRRRVRETVLGSSVWDHVGAPRSGIHSLFDAPPGSNPWGLPFRIWTAYQLARWWESGGLHRWWRHAVRPTETQGVKHDH